MTFSLVYGLCAKFNVLIYFFQMMIKSLKLCPNDSSKSKLLPKYFICYTHSQCLHQHGTVDRIDALTITLILASCAFARFTLLR